MEKVLTRTISASEMQETQSREREGNRFHEKYITLLPLQSCSHVGWEGQDDMLMRLS